MRLAFAVALVVAGLVAAGAVLVVAILDHGERRMIALNGVEVRVPSGWHRAPSAGDGPVVDPVTVLVVGTEGARPRASACQVAAYHVPSGGAVVVVVRWRTETSGGGRMPRSREPLESIELDRGGFDCWPGHLGGAAQLALDGHAYQVNVMIGDRAAPERIAEALSVARSFDRARR